MAADFMAMEIEQRRHQVKFDDEQMDTLMCITVPATQAQRQDQQFQPQW